MEAVPSFDQDVFESRIEQLDYWRGCDTDGNCRIQRVENVESFWTWMQSLGCK